MISAHADFGTLAAGMSADVIAVAGDPLEDLEQLRDVRLVIGRGTTHVLDTAALG